MQQPNTRWNLTDPGPTAPRVVKMKPLNVPNSKPLFLGLQGDATYAPASSSGGWQVVDRPKRVAATQWFDRAVWSLTLNGIIANNISAHHDYMNTLNAASVENVSIEPECLMLERWMDHIQGSLEPPVFSLEGPVPGIQHTWILFSLEFGEALRNPKAGFRYQQNVKLVLYEYRPPFGSKFVNIQQGHVDKYKYNTESGTQTIKMYTIGSQDTLRKIANRFHLGSDGVKALQTLNGIRDPKNIVVGQTIMIPGYK